MALMDIHYLAVVVQVEQGVIAQLGRTAVMGEMVVSPAVEAVEAAVDIVLTPVLLDLAVQVVRGML
jgi:hypothetical protein